MSLINSDSNNIESPKESDLNFTPLRVIGLTTLFALIILAHYVTKPARDAYVTEHWGSKAVPYIAIGLLGISLIVAKICSKVYMRHGPLPLLPYVAGITVAYYLSFPLCLTASPSLAALGLTLSISLFNLFGLAIAWGAIDSCYRSRNSWGAFIVIGAGGPIGAIVGGLIASSLSTSSGPYATLVAGAVFVSLASILYCVVVGWRHPDMKDSNSVTAVRGIYLYKDRYVQGLLFFALFASCLSAVFKWSIFRMAENNGGDATTLTKYFASIYTQIGFVSLAAQLIVTTVAFRFLGPKRSLLVVPFLVILGGMTGAVISDVQTLSLVVVVYLGLDYTLNQCAKELAYIPTDENIRFGQKSYIDSVGKQLGVVIGNGALVVLSGLLYQSSVAISMLIILLGVGWIVTTLPLWFRVPHSAATAIETPPSS